MAACLVLCACADSSTEVRLSSPDVQSFEVKVYPILLRDCGFPACHGDTRRFFHIFGPGRTRYRPGTETLLFAPPTAEELTASYNRTRSMLVTEGDAEDSLLLQKPLEAGHEGHDEWGQNVYWTANDPAYQAILGWAKSSIAPAADAGGP